MDRLISTVGPCFFSDQCWMRQFRRIHRFWWKWNLLTVEFIKSLRRGKVGHAHLFPVVSYTLPRFIFHNFAASSDCRQWHTQERPACWPTCILTGHKVCPCVRISVCLLKVAWNYAFDPLTNLLEVDQNPFDVIRYTDTSNQIFRAVAMLLSSLSSTFSMLWTRKLIQKHQFLLLPTSGVLYKSM